MMLAISLTGLFMGSCGGGDDDHEYSTDSSNTDSETGNTASIATDYIKTVTLKPISRDKWQNNAVSTEECLIYKDFYYKHSLFVSNDLYTNAIAIGVKSYLGQGSGWTYKGDCAVIKDYGQVSSIEDIKTKSSFKYDYDRYSFSDGTSYGYHYHNAFRPGHGYEVAFYIGSISELKWLRIFPVKYTLNDNDELTSLTIQYQLY